MTLIEDFGEDDRLFLFKMPYDQEYKRRILTLLGLASGLTYVIPYRPKYLSPAVRQAVLTNPEAFEGKKVMCFCVDAKLDENYLMFYPLRECTIRKVWKAEDSDFVNFRVTVEGCLSSNPADCTKELIEKYGEDGLPPRPEDTFVKLAKKLDSVASVDFNDTNWDTQVAQLSALAEFKKHAFYRLVAVTDQTGALLNTEDIGPERGYKLKGGSTYQIRLSVRLPHHYESGGLTSTNIRCELAKDLGKVVHDEVVEVRTRYESKDYFTLICSRVNTSRKITVRDSEDEYKAPKFEVPVQVSSISKWWVFILGFIFFAGGSGLMTFSQIYGDLSTGYRILLSAIGAGFAYLAVHGVVRYFKD